MGGGTTKKPESSVPESFYVCRVSFEDDQRLIFVIESMNFAAIEICLYQVKSSLERLLVYFILTISFRLTNVLLI